MNKTPQNIYYMTKAFTIIKATLLGSTIFLSTSPIVAAYEVPTHAKVTEKAISQSINYQAFESIFEINGDRSIIEGSRLEDNGARPRNHFYDPTNGLGLNINGISLGKPSLEWGFKDDSLLFSNNYSWTRAREYMYIALTGTNFNGDTVAATADERNQYSQLMFRSVGQVIHLVEDLASPAHVRNDLHLPVGLAGDLYEHFVLNKYDPSWALGYPTVQLNQFSDYWNSSQGLAVFTNSNFISQNTNFDDRNIDGNLFYPSPQIQGIITKTQEITDQFNHTVQVQVDYGTNVIEDPNTRAVFTNDRLTAFSIFDFQARELLNEPVYSVNDFTIESAASILVPRAVGYSAGLLDYFFRGDLAARRDGGVDGIKITNAGIEDMNGTFALYYDATDGTRKQAEGASWNFELPFNCAPFPFCCIRCTSDRLTFTVPTDAKEPGKYILVFNGQLGAEQNAVVGKIVDLAVQHVFIIQDSLTLNSIPFEESLPTDSDIFLQEGAKKIWPTDHQIQTGRFVTYGTIKSISLVAATGAQLYLDNVNYPSGVWNIGDTPDPPSQWRVEGPAGAFVALVVVMKDGTVIRQAVFSIASFSSIREKSFSRSPCDPNIPFYKNCKPNQTIQIIEFDNVRSSRQTSLTLNASNGEHGGATTSTTLSISDTSGSRSILILDEFHIPNFGAFSPNIGPDAVVYSLQGVSPPTGIPYVYVTHLVEKLWPICSSVNIQEGGFISYQILSYDDIKANENRYHLFGGPFGSSITIGNIGAVAETGAVGISNNCSDPYNYYNSLAVPAYIPLALSGQIDRIYSQAEMDYLDSLGIQPEQYSIILQ